MGIDIYMRWNGQTEEEKKAQITGFSIAHGHVGYLREAYHGAPYATEVLVPEAFDAEETGDDEEEDRGVPISAKVLRERLPDALDACRRRYRDEPRCIEWSTKSFTDFVELAERKEAETREPVRIIAS